MLLRDTSLPFVVDFECAEVFALYQRVALSRPWARTHLKAALEDPQLRFLLPWSEAARRGLCATIGPATAAHLAGKLRTVLPAIRPAVEQSHQREQGPLRVLFLGTAFLAKGGVDAIHAVRAARSTHDVTLDIVSDVPSEWLSLAEATTGVTLHRWPAGADLVRALFARSDVLLFPSHMDTLGFVMLEAMAHGIPVLAGRHFAAPEIVEHDVSGLLFRAENPLYGEDGRCRFPRTLPAPRSFRHALARPSEGYVEEIATMLTRVAEERDLYERLAAGALVRVLEGPLSIQQRREALRQVYATALDS
jgi:glycosyltransferase involved in cell wall biosynthesis